MIKFDVFSRWTGALQFTAEIDCAEDALTSVKLGLAVKWAFRTGASLVGARLVGASLVGASRATPDIIARREEIERRRRLHRPVRRLLRAQREAMTERLATELSTTLPDRRFS